MFAENISWRHGRLNGDTIVTTVMSNLGLYKACDKSWHEV